MTKGPHAGKFSVKYKDDPNWWTHSHNRRLRLLYAHTNTHTTVAVARAVACAFFHGLTKWPAQGTDV